jgi:hypothetical protein
MDDIGKLLIVFGVVIVIVGVVLVFFGRIPWLGRLPGDIVIQRDNFSCFFPIATSILVSVILTIASLSSSE